MTQDIERAKEFLATLDDDTELQSKMAAAKSAEARRKVIEAAGFEGLSPEAVKKAVVAKKGEAGELSEEELGAAAGAGGIRLSVPYVGDLDVDW